jgi:hypothetical protein
VVVRLGLHSHLAQPTGCIRGGCYPRAVAPRTNANRLHRTSPSPPVCIRGGCYPRAVAPRTNANPATAAGHRQVDGASAGNLVRLGRRRPDLQPMYSNSDTTIPSGPRT